MAEGNCLICKLANSAFQMLLYFHISEELFFLSYLKEFEAKIMRYLIACVA
jgi:hypothetical protein